MPSIPRDMSQSPSLFPHPHRSMPSQSDLNGSGMSAASRYHSNLKVLRRRDPSIVSIFDQFSHVCVYHYTGKAWEKQGYEGSMFLYERDTYPPYGFYILNRMGMDDYNQRLYPEDNLHQHDDYVMLRSYPDFTTRRLAEAGTPGDKFDEKYKVDLDNITNDQKGRAHTISLWVYNKGPMVERMLRLNDCIKKNQPYPEEFKSGPDRPPQPTTPSLANALPVQHGSQIDQLFAKLQQPETATSSTSITLQSLFASAATNEVTTNNTVDSLFAGLSKGPSMPEEVTPARPALLNSIFASISPDPNPQPVIPIHSPTPNATPQVLTLDVISKLMGLPSSRATSSASGSRRTGSSREGDCEDFSDDPAVHSFSESSTVLEEEEEVQSRDGFLAVSGSRSRNGDITPRAPANGISLPVPSSSNSDSTIQPTPSSSTGALVVPTTASSNGRPLVPFAPDSELWPYDHSGHSNGHSSDDEVIVELDFQDTSALSDLPADGEKPRKMSRRERKRLKEKEREAIEKSWDIPVPTVPEIHTQHANSSSSTVLVNGIHPVNGKGKGKEKEGDVIKDSILATVDKRAVVQKSKTEFVREVLTLIHTDKSFVDDLWTEYLEKQGSF